MYVKSLTLKGFKSFASATHLRLEPGITCIVGPNGSGKSNVVDALSWVMGEQGAKSLRGGKMEDVIFAGTAGRPALGRAEVTMTIDNSDGALPIDYAEVTISRIMFRGGGSDYAINGTTCRLIDIQELLSDAGIGREMHVIVGQGQLDAVLRATPEERRGFVEEAAGVLKHRKRKEKALRKLATMESKLVRVKDLTAEIRRQLGPLGRQAETARRAALIQAEARDSRLRLLADDLVQLTTTLDKEIAGELETTRRRDLLAEETRQGLERLKTVEERIRSDAPQVKRAEECCHALSLLTERLEAVADQAGERERLLSSPAEESRTSGPDPAHLQTQSVAAREQEAKLAAELHVLREELETSSDQREQLEKAWNAERARLDRAERAAADRREGLAQLAGQVAARRSRVDSLREEIGRLRQTVAQSEERAGAAAAEFARLESSIVADEDGETLLDEAYEKALDALAALRAEVDAIREQERAAEGDRSAAQGRLEALALALRRKDGAAVLLGDGENPAHPGVKGSLAQLMTVHAGHEAAIAAALDRAVDAVVVDTVDTVDTAITRLRDQDAGRAVLLLPGELGEQAVISTEEEAGADWVRAQDVVEVPPQIRAVVDRLLSGVFLVEDAVAARDVLRAFPEASAVTRQGDVYAADFVRGGSASVPSQLELQAARSEAEERAAAAGARRDRSRFRMRELLAEVSAYEAEAEAALTDLHASDARINALAERLGGLGAQVRSAKAECARGERAIARVAQQLEDGERELAALQGRLAAAEEEPISAAESSVEERDRLERALAKARAEETEVHLRLRGCEERVRSAKGRAEALEARARAECAAREQAERRRRRREHQRLVAAGIRVQARQGAARLRDISEKAEKARDEAVSRREAEERGLRDMRLKVGELTDSLRELTDSMHRDEVARTQLRLRIEQVQNRAVEELGIEPDSLVEEFGPHRPVPVLTDVGRVPGAGGSESLSFHPYVRVEQERRLRSAERGLSRLGKINPLALEEYAALEERHRFLVEQLEDLKSGKRDLLAIVKEVDDRVEKVFAEAFADTAREFEGVFSRLFPGGEGKLVLTDPNDLLTTGIEVEARPPGKRIKRLSLLSGGERSLTAVALLVSIFKARPSPFYIMDEVEAALDDTNLGRLIGLFEELRDSSQLIVITHQKRTMEVADALYGVTMRGDGVTTVVSQRIRGLAQVPGLSGSNTAVDDVRTAQS
ncbi:condensin subunit Smc [Austwickia chelonae]|uniref:Chromosome partition protein Smc n=1 Tax=Austwickia chelonae NBRC 105200 TaxID=1184607 RepID=K6UKP4_9MICO|nr:chromosome segregation protein SMC [Austwickia chelonae]GAB76581.1 chromosome partition protein SMC [Austwickia chelonae NBRC 105200]SEW27305.1 condensin subunit Smc [Austwickia chelonae]